MNLAANVLKSGACARRLKRVACLPGRHSERAECRHPGLVGGDERCFATRRFPFVLRFADAGIEANAGAMTVLVAHGMSVAERTLPG